MRLLAALLITSLACGKGSPTSVALSAGRRVLFVGNSLTYQNDMPAMVERLVLVGGDTIQSVVVAFPNFALIDHTAEGSAPALLRRGGWEYVILQQGPSTVGVNRDTLVLATQLLAPSIRTAGAKPALLMVWPESSRTSAFPLVHDSYKAAADAVGGVFIPAGDAWQAAWTADPSLALYGADGYHPTVTASYLVALTVYEKITGKDARLLPTNALDPTAPIPATVVRALQNAAHAANLANPGR